MPTMPPPQQPQATPERTHAGWITLICYLLLAILLVVGVGAVAFFFARPHFIVSSLSVSGGRVAFNVSATNTNRHFRVIYMGATWASLWFHGAPVASGPALSGDDWWYQPAMNTTTVAGVLDTVEPSFHC